MGVILVVALFLVVPCLIALTLVRLHGHGAAAETRERAAQRPVRPAADAPTVVIPAQVLAAVAADWELVARQQRRDSMPRSAALSDHWADEARQRARTVRAPTRGVRRG